MNQAFRARNPERKRELFEMGGQTRWLKWEVRPWYASNKEIGGIIVFTEDITKQITPGRRAETREE